MLLVDVKDEGTDSVADVKDIQVMEPTTWDELQDLYWYLVENPTKYKTVVIDTVTQVQQLLVQEIGAGNKFGKAAGEWGSMRKQDWGTVASEMKVWLTNMRDLPMEIIFIAQDRVFNIEEEEGSDGMIDPEVGPRLSPSIASHLNSIVSVIANTFIREKVKEVKVKGKTKEVRSKEYCIRLGPNAYYITKIRKPRDIDAPDYLTDPTYEDILDIIQGE